MTTEIVFLFGKVLFIKLKSAIFGYLKNIIYVSGNGITLYVISKIGQTKCESIGLT